MSDEKAPSPREWLVRLLAQEREAGRTSDTLDDVGLPEVDMRTLLAEWTALKAELRAETSAAREQRAMLKDTLAVVQRQHEQQAEQRETIQAALLAQESGANTTIDVPDAAIQALIEAADRLHPAIDSARRLAAPRKSWFRTIEDPVAKGLCEGLELSLQRLLLQLHKWQVKPLDALGKEFDPNSMQAIGTCNDPDAPEATVVEVVTRGYQGPQGVIRWAQVIVNKTQPKSIGEGQER